ncbi:MAG: DUF1684 domain-containing protein [Acidobacteria bacterium]|nr:DUF1684 domain-containing protein [Acidobacteriota bacterium]
MRNARPFIVLALGLSVFPYACKPASPPVDPAYSAEIHSWRAQREEKLTASDGWLSLVGLDWLEEGDNEIGSDPEATVFLEVPGIPQSLGKITLLQGQTTLEVNAGADVRLDGDIVDQPTILLSDAEEGGPDLLQIERLTAYVIKRGDRMAVRVKDPEAPTRLGFAGLEYFPLNSTLKVEARLEAFPEPRDVIIPTAAGTQDHMLCPGILHFTVEGLDLTLQPWIETPDDRDLFIVFTDGTSGRLTYGAGRFLSAELRKDGTATLDFNRATTPPCGFTPFATCPLAPPENALAVDILAGEQLLGH